MKLFVGIVLVLLPLMAYSEDHSYWTLKVLNGAYCGHNLTRFNFEGFETNHIFVYGPDTSRPILHQQCRERCQQNNQLDGIATCEPFLRQ